MNETLVSQEREVMIPVGYRQLGGVLRVPADPRGVVVFPHGNGNGRFATKSKLVAKSLEGAGMATFLLDLLEEEEADEREMMFDIELLAHRLEIATGWLSRNPATRALQVGYFGNNTAAAAALVAASEIPNKVHAVVARGGRPDLAMGTLSEIEAPTLLIVGGEDRLLVELNEEAIGRLDCTKQLTLLPGVTRQFEEPGAMQNVADITCEWFLRHLVPDTIGHLCR